jgi:hypothetical protein
MVAPGSSTIRPICKSRRSFPGILLKVAAIYLAHDVPTLDLDLATAPGIRGMSVGLH